MNGSNLMLEFESQGAIYFGPRDLEGKNICAKYRCFYQIVDWQFLSEKFERWDVLSQRWIHCQLGEPMSNVFHEYQQKLLNAEMANRYAPRVLEEA